MKTQLNKRGLVRDINRVIRLVKQRENQVNSNIDFQVKVKYYDVGYKVIIKYPDPFFNEVIYDRSEGEYVDYSEIFYKRYGMNKEKVTGQEVQESLYMCELWF